MGLDQSAFYKDAEDERVEIQYWRKHNALQGWMEKLWRKKGGTGEFNCTPVELTKDDLADLQDTVVNNELPETCGFFFGGDSRLDDDQKGATLDFIKDANKLIDSGEKVFYDSWW
jgi:hypothetical protein